jgi:hypothetical protein
MVILAALVFAMTPAQEPPAPAERVAAERQAVAMVRILPGAQIKFAELEETAPHSFTDSRIRGADGSLEPARLVEFH